MDVLKAHGVRGKVGEVFTLPTLGRIRAGSVMLVGLGPKDAAGAGVVRKVSMKAARAATKIPVVASTLVQVGQSSQDAAHAFVEGVSLGAYRFDRYKNQPLDEGSKEKPRLKRVVALSPDDQAAVRAGLARGEVYAEA